MRQRRRDESGVALVLVMVFLFVTSIVLLSIAGATSNDLLNSSNLKAQRSVEYAADGATTMAVQTARYSPSTYIQPGPSDCLPGGSPQNIDTVEIWVECTGIHYDPTSEVTRIIDFRACTTKDCPNGSVILRARVVFDDYSAAHIGDCAPNMSSTCGTAMTIESWILETANH